VRCRHTTCGKQKSLKQLRREIAILTGFYQQQPAYRVASDLGLNYQTVTRVYQCLREAIYHVADLEAGKLKGEIEIDEAYFGGRRRCSRHRLKTAAQAAVFLWFPFRRSIADVLIERMTLMMCYLASQRINNFSSYQFLPRSITRESFIQIPESRCRSSPETISACGFFRPGTLW
jgi:hypothetical protein